MVGWADWIQADSRLASQSAGSKSAPCSEDCVCEVQIITSIAILFHQFNEACWRAVCMTSAASLLGAVSWSCPRSRRLCRLSFSSCVFGYYSRSFSPQRSRTRRRIENLMRHVVEPAFLMSEILQPFDARILLSCAYCT